MSEPADPLANPIAEPLVELPDVSPTSALVDIQATAQGAVTLMLNDPKRKNALGADLCSALADALETLRGAEGVRVVFLRGAGGAFSVGGDLASVRAAVDQSEAQNRDDAQAMAQVLKALWDLPMLTVALIDGEAFGAAVGLVAACDSAVSTADAMFRVGEVRMGLPPALVSPYLIAAVGPRAARRLFAAAPLFNAAEALRIGLIDEVAPDAAGLARVQARIARESLACAPGAVAQAKALVGDIQGQEIDHHLIEDTARRAAQAWTSSEAQEGVAAVLGGREPSWTAGA